MKEYEFKKFGEITLLDIDTNIDLGYIRICNEDDYINNIIITIEEIKSITILYSLFGYALLDTSNCKFCYKDGYLEIEYVFGTMIFNKNDVDEFSNYIEREYADE